MSVILFGILLPWLVVGLGCWLGYQLVRQNGRILVRLETLEHRLGQISTAPAPARVPEPAPPPSLPLGSFAPEFELPDLEGNRRALSAFRGRRLLLIFFNPRCGFCTRMASDLAALPTDGADGRPLPLVISTGDAEENRKLVAEHGLRCPVLLQEQMEVASRYQCHGTPMGYLIDEAGNIASDLAVGSQALLALAGPRDGATGRQGDGATGHPEHRGNRELSDSKLNRTGLPAGTPAPDFTLPALEGGTLSLEQFRGRPVLLVFSDPHCGPCNQLAPELEQAHRRGGEMQILMVSRGDWVANAAKADEHKLTFPNGLQKQWEISRAYGMFATPIAYRIDAAGVIAGEVAAGVEPIRALLARAAAPAHGKRPMHRQAWQAVAGRQ
jgi:peroxiredoxin